MQCPHCRYEFDTKPHTFSLGIDQDGAWQVASTRCPTCDRLIVSLCTDRGCTYPAWPASTTRPWLSEDVPADLAAEYHTAAQIIYHSPEASAAISRRLLHRFLAGHVDAGEGGLAEQIGTAVASSQLPPYLKEALCTLSRVASLDLHETKSTLPEALAGVEPGEADWLLDVLDPLFELYFVQPARMQRKVALLEEQTGLLTTLPQVESQESTGPAENPSPTDETWPDEDDGATDAAEAGENAHTDGASDPDAPAESDQNATAGPEPTPAATAEASAQTAATEGEAERGGWRRLTGRASDERR
jgi:hypothetical protein